MNAPNRFKAHETIADVAMATEDYLSANQNYWKAAKETTDLQEFERLRKLAEHAYYLHNTMEDAS